jgi:hypothetical protein
VQVWPGRRGRAGRAWAAGLRRFEMSGLIGI